MQQIATEAAHKQQTNQEKFEELFDFSAANVYVGSCGLDRQLVKAMQAQNTKCPKFCQPESVAQDLVIDGNNIKYSITDDDRDDDDRDVTWDKCGVFFPLLSLHDGTVQPTILSTTILWG